MPELFAAIRELPTSLQITGAISVGIFVAGLALVLTWILGAFNRRPPINKARHSRPEPARVDRNPLNIHYRYTPGTANPNRPLNRTLAFPTIRPGTPLAPPAVDPEATENLNEHRRQVTL